MKRCLKAGMFLTPLAQTYSMSGNDFVWGVAASVVGGLLLMAARHVWNTRSEGTAQGRRQYLQNQTYV